MSSVNPAIVKYGWTAVPRDVELLLKQSEAGDPPAPALSVTDIPIPDSNLAKEVLAYAKRELSTETFNHSMRVYCFGQAIITHSFPSWKSESFSETYLLACLLHDIGTTDTNISATMLSFEFYGGMLSLDFLRSLDPPAPIEQAENVAEAVIRHQDLGTTGTVTSITALLQLATILDNMGAHSVLVSKKTIESVVGTWPRKGWSTCFARTIRRENGLKPWAHTTHLGEREFPEGVEGNELMAPFDG